MPNNSFQDRIQSVFQGRFEEKANQDAEWTYEKCSIFENKIAVGQPNGWISVFDCDTKKLLSEFKAFEELVEENLVDQGRCHWEDVVMNSKYIAASANRSGKGLNLIHTFIYIYTCT